MDFPLGERIAETAESLEHMRATEDDVDANSLGEMIASDPLMTLKVLAHAHTLKRGSSAGLRAAPETVTSALVLMGITPFFRAFGPQPTLEDALADHEDALLGLSRVMQRAERASRFALAFAAHRADPDAAILHSAALLHDFAEMLLWVHAPDLALRIAALQAADLVSTLEGASPFTVFAPNDDAFAKLPAGTVENLLKPENKAKLQEILKYHVVSGNVMAKDVVSLTSAKTVAGTSLAIAVKGDTVMVDDAKVVKADIACSNGVLHVLDRVVLPKS